MSGREGRGPGKKEPWRILTVVPHAGLIVPEEIEPDTLADDRGELARNIDWHTDRLYDFRDIFGDGPLVFPYCSLILEANRNPKDLDAAVPLKDVWGRPVYRSGKEPRPELRRRMSAKYLEPFHASLGDAISAGADFFLEGHSTVSARGMDDRQIDVMNVQLEPSEGQTTRFCPDALIQAYAGELQKRLPETRITINASDYLSVYGHICAIHSIDAPGRVGRKAPAVLQETNQNLYLRPDGTLDIARLNRLRRAFAESLQSVRAVFSS